MNCLFFVLLSSLTTCQTLWLYSSYFMFAYPALPVSSGLNVDDLRQRTIKFFGPGTEYDTPVNNPYREKGGIIISSFSSIIN